MDDDTIHALYSFKTLQTRKLVILIMRGIVVKQCYNIFSERW